MHRLNERISPRTLRGWIWLPLLFIIVSLACSMPGFRGATPTPQPPAVSPTPAIPPTPTATPEPLPPDLVEIDPPPGVELSLNRQLTLYFNQPMERTSVQQDLQVQSAVPTDLEWVDDSTLILHPQDLLPPESEVILSLGGQARSLNGLALTRPVQLSYRTVGYLRPEKALPEGGTAEVDPQSAVVVTFNRPVVPLGETEGLPAAFSLDPQAPGRGEWLNTSTFIFYPEPALNGGAVYTARLNPDLRSLDGSPLDESDPLLEWSFSTALPRLIKIEPSPENGQIPLDAKFKLYFNQPMEPASVEDQFALLDGSGAALAGSFQWQDDNREVEFQPSRLLQRGVTYTMQLNGEARSAGGASLSAFNQYFLQTYPQLGVQRSEPVQGGVKQNYAGVTLYMSGPLLQNVDLTKYISMQPEVPNLAAWWSEYDRMLGVTGDFTPRIDYTLIVSADLPDPWGGSLGQPYVLNFRSAPLDPALFINLYSDVLFLTPEDDAIAVQATNLSQLPLQVGRLPLQDFVQLYSGPDSYNRRQSYRSPDQRSWTQALSLTPDRSENVKVFLTPGGETLSPGLYYMRFNTGNERIYAGPYLLAVSNIQMMMKLSANQAFIWAVSVDTGQPLAQAPVRILGPQGELLGEGQTDEQGVSQVNIATLQDPYSVVYAVTGEPGDPDFGVALSNWNQGVSPWDFGLQSDLQGPRLKGYLYTDRPIYRPGDQVNFRAVIRQANNGRYTLPDLGSLPLTLYQDYGNPVVNFDLPLSEMGTANGFYILPPEARPGTYRLASPLSDFDISINFDVAEYRKPEINLSVELPDAQAQTGETDTTQAALDVLAGDPVTAQVQARYFFGAPAGAVNIKWVVYEQPATFAYSDYQVGVQEPFNTPFFYFPSEEVYLGTPVDQGESQTDSSGLLTLQINPEPRAQRMQYILEATATDETGLPVSARVEWFANPADFYIAARADSYVARAGNETGFDVLVVDWLSQPAGSRSLRAEFSQVTWRPADETAMRGFPQPPVAVYTLEGSTDFTTSQTGKARLVFTPSQPGTYQLDIQGEGAHTSFFLWVGGEGNPLWPQLPEHKLELTSDRESYQPGDTALLFIPNPLAGEARALLAVERGLVMEHQIFTLPASGGSISVPLDDEDAPNVYLSITLLGKAADGLPDYRQGYLNLKVNPRANVLQVDLTSQPQQAGPGEAVSFGVRVTDSSGAPVQGEFSLSVVDRAVLALADPNSPDIVSAFYGNQPLGVRTGLSLSAYVGRVNDFNPGGGGGGGGLEIQTVARENFPDTAFWSADIRTDAQGQAQVNMNLPDSLTTWQVLVRGLDADTRVGESEIDLITSKELLVRPVIPRFLVSGDHVLLAAVVQNNTTADLEVQVSLQGSGIVLDNPDAALYQVNLPAAGRQRVEWWATVQDAASADLLFQAVAGDLQDAVRPVGGNIPVLRYEVPQTFRTAGVLSEGEEALELVSLPRSFTPDNASLGVELSSSLAGVTLSALESLQHSRYETTEQTISRFLANLEMLDTLNRFSLEQPDLRANLETNISLGLKRLQLVQNEDGGWGWWYRQDSDVFLSAYILFGLSRASLAGVQIEPQVLQKATGYLQATLVPASMLQDDNQLDQMAMVHFALAESGSADLPGLNELFNVHERLSPWAQAMLALSLEDASPGSEAARLLLTNLQSSAVRSATGAHWELNYEDWQQFSSPIANSSVVLYALARQDPNAPLVAEVTRYLVTLRRGDGGWGSTHTTAWVLLSLMQVLRGTGELDASFSYEAQLNGNLLAAGQSDGGSAPVAVQAGIERLNVSSPNALRILRQPGAGRLYYTAALTASRPVESAPALNQGIEVSRSYYSGSASCLVTDCPALSDAQIGDKLLVRVTLTLPQDVYYLVVEDYLPAGSEAADIHLKTSQLGDPSLDPNAVEQEPLFDPSQPFQQGWEWWLFSPARIYDDHVTWGARFLPAGTYVLTYKLLLLQAGDFRVLPARASLYYSPEVQGSSAGTVFSIRP